MREICKSGSMSGVWRRSHGRTSEAPPNERGGNRYVRPTATAPHLDSTETGHWIGRLVKCQVFEVQNCNPLQRDPFQRAEGFGGKARVHCRQPETGFMMSGSCGTRHLPAIASAHPALTQRRTASAVSVGFVLKQSFACGACSCTTLISFSNKGVFWAISRTPAPIRTQSGADSCWPPGSSLFQLVLHRGRDATRT